MWQVIVPDDAGATDAAAADMLVVVVDINVVFAVDSAAGVVETDGRIDEALGAVKSKNEM